MRLIDADALKKLVKAFRNDAPQSSVRKYVCDVILSMLGDENQTPTIESEPVRHGRWEECDWVEYDGHSECVRYPKKGRVCTSCRNAFKKEFIDSPRVHYCPNCGAKMDGGTDDGN